MFCKCIMESSNTTAFVSSPFGVLCSSFDAVISNSSYVEFLTDDGLTFIDDTEFLHQPLHYPKPKIISKIVGCEIRFKDDDIITIEEQLNKIENKACLYCGRDEEELKNDGETHAVIGCACQSKNLICLTCNLGYAKSCCGSAVNCAFREHKIHFDRKNITEQTLKVIEHTNNDYRNYIKEKVFNEGFKYNYEFWKSNIKGKTDYYDDYSEIYNYFVGLLITAIRENFGNTFNEDESILYKSFYFYDEDDDNIIKWEMGGYDFKDPNFCWNGFELKALVRVENRYEKIRINLEKLDDVADRLQDHFSDGYINGYRYSRLFDMLDSNFHTILVDSNNEFFLNLVNSDEGSDEISVFIEMCYKDNIRTQIYNSVDTGEYTGDELGYYYTDTEFRCEELIVWFDTYEDVFNHH